LNNLENEKLKSFLILQKLIQNDKKLYTNTASSYLSNHEPFDAITRTDRVQVRSVQ
jgi:hypothetical protein